MDRRSNAFHMVARMRYDGREPAEPWLGTTDWRKPGSGPGQFKYPTGVATDSKGRVYVADYINDRIQVFTPEGRHLKSLGTVKPVKVDVHPHTGEIFVFSWALGNELFSKRGLNQDIPPSLTHYGPLENFKRKAKYDLPLKGYRHRARFYYGWGPFRAPCTAAVDFWAKPLTVWLVPKNPRRQSDWAAFVASKWKDAGPLLLVPEKGRLKVKRDFGKEAHRAVSILRPPEYANQRLYVSPRTGRLSVVENLEYDGTNRNFGFGRIIEIDPETGKIREIPTPFNAGDMCYDINGLIYMHSNTMVARYEPSNWREVPWDYGEERKSVGYAHGAGKRAPVIAALRNQGAATWNSGEMGVSPMGNLVVACHMTKDAYEKKVRKAPPKVHKADAYTPKLYPGRAVYTHKQAVIHVWDRHGQILHRDPVPGTPDTYGVEIDREGDIYFLASATRCYGGKKYFDDMTGTVMKFKPHKGRILAASRKKDVCPVPLKDADRPKRPVDIYSAKLGGGAWVQGAEWMYGGVGRFGQVQSSCGCSCSIARFALDYFRRSFAPEIGRYSVAVLDANGNVILRLGRYGSVDDGKPLVADGGPAVVNAIGGDEVALFHACLVATHTDRRLFIADHGNSRILSVKLGYHAEEKVRLKDVPDSDEASLSSGH